MVLLVARTSGWIDVALTLGWVVAVFAIARRWMGRRVE
jgi:hypothetical protein